MLRCGSKIDRKRYLKISKRNLDFVLNNFLNDPEELEFLMEGLAKAGKNNPHFLALTQTIYNEFRNNQTPKYAAMMSMLAGFALGWEMHILGNKSETTLAFSAKIH